MTPLFGCRATDMTPTLAEKVPRAKLHKFYVTANAIVLVSPSDRKVADVIKR